MSFFPPILIDLIFIKLTVRRKENSKGTKNKIPFWNPFIIAFSLGLLALLVYIGYRMQISTRRLVPISVLALITGVFYESKRMSQKLAPILLIGLASLTLSFFSFLPGRHEKNYDFENHIEIWPYSFILLFTIFSIVYHGEKVIPKLTEGITLLQSVAVIYWVIDYGFLETENIFLLSIMFIGTLYSGYSIVHAFTSIELTRSNRLTLSIWSSVMMLLLASDNIFRIYQNDHIENTSTITDGLYIGMQYFLLGVSAIYIVQNFLMLSGFLPGRGTFFNSEYFRELEKLKKEHIKRYAANQVSIGHSLFCVLFTGIVYFINYQYDLLPRNIIIWAMFVTFPYILLLFEHAIRKSNAFQND